MNDVPDFIKRALESGKSTSEAKDVPDSNAQLDRIEAMLNRILNGGVTATLSTPVPVETPPPVIAPIVVETLLISLRDGKKIDAIRMVRHITRLGLKEAKDLVEKYWPWG